VYKMVVGDNAIGNTRGTSVSQITRPPAETMLVVEAQLPVPWMSPSDFAAEDFQTAIYANDFDKVWEIRNAHLASKWEWIDAGVEVIDGKETHNMRRKTPEDQDRLNELAKRQILGGHGRELHNLFADGTVKTYWD